MYSGEASYVLPGLLELILLTFNWVRVEKKTITRRYEVLIINSVLLKILGLTKSCINYLESLLNG